MTCHCLCETTPRAVVIQNSTKYFYLCDSCGLRTTLSDSLILAEIKWNKLIANMAELGFVEQN